MEIFATPGWRILPRTYSRQYEATSRRATVRRRGETVFFLKIDYRMMNDADRSDLRVLADYQFGRGAGDALFPPDESLSIERSRSGRPRQVKATAGRIVSVVPHGRFTLGIEGGRRLHRALPEAYYVTVNAESEPYVRDGRNAFAKFVRGVDPAVRPDDEVRVTSEDGSLLAVGRAAVSASAARDFETGVAVSVREGAGTPTPDQGDDGTGSQT
jgi:uncharacterized protein with predicted RNA binding PUA domain